jgi:dipeptidase E
LIALAGWDAVLILASHPVVMPKLYLIGGENVHHRSAQNINAQAFQDAGNRPNILVFPWASIGFDRNYSKRKLLVDYFRSLGAKDVDFAEYDHFENIIEKLTWSDLVYLTGGQTFVLLERLGRSGIADNLRNYNGVIVGRSAGALALCNKCLTTYRGNKETKLSAGLGLVNITMKAHYRKGVDDVLKRFSFNKRVFAVPSKSALVYEDSRLSAIGEVYIFFNGVSRLFKETIF